MTVRLYDYWRSSASYRVRIALNLAGIEHETVSVNLLEGAQRSSEHLARNPQGLVPVLEIDGQSFTQSLSIIDYLDETRGLALLPKDPAVRAHVRAAAYAIAVDLHPVCNLHVVAHVAELVPGETTRADWMRHFIRPGLEAFEGLLARFEQRPFCAGDRPTLADICLVPQLYNAERWQVPLHDLPRIASVARACAAHPAFAAAHPERHAPAG